MNVAARCSAHRSWRYLKWCHRSAYQPTYTVRWASQDAQTNRQTLGVADLKEAPVPALAYGLGGLVPFVTIPAHMVNAGVFIPELAYCHLAYGAIILSFLGGTRWGLTLPHPQANSLEPDWANLGWAVAPSLIGWAGLLVSTSAGVASVAGGLSLVLFKDLKTEVYPQWFKALRVLLTSVAVTALLITLTCQYLLPREQSVQ